MKLTPRSPSCTRSTTSEMLAHRCPTFNCSLIIAETTETVASTSSQSREFMLRFAVSEVRWSAQPGWGSPCLLAPAYSRGWGEELQLFQQLSSKWRKCFPHQCLFSSFLTLFTRRQTMFPCLLCFESLTIIGSYPKRDFLAHCFLLL